MDNSLIEMKHNHKSAANWFVENITMFLYDESVTHLDHLCSGKLQRRQVLASDVTAPRLCTPCAMAGDGPRFSTKTAIAKPGGGLKEPCPKDCRQITWEFRPGGEIDCHSKLSEILTSYHREQTDVLPAGRPESRCNREAPKLSELEALSAPLRPTQNFQKTS